jgi:hypothetical protein
MKGWKGEALKWLKTIAELALFAGLVYGIYQAIAWIGGEIRP